MLRDSPLAARILSALVLIPLCLYGLYKGPPYSLMIGVLGAGGLLWEWVRLLGQSHLSPLPRMLYGLGGTLYISTALTWTLQHLMHPKGCWLIAGLFCLVWATDTAAFVGGQFFKGPKLAPSISPHKTWSGFIAGMVAGVGVGYSLVGTLFPATFSILGIILLVLMAQMGDLLESKAKRWSHVKDSGTLIPGHGGLLDRLDSFMAVCFILALWQFIAGR